MTLHIAAFSDLLEHYQHSSWIPLQRMSIFWMNVLAQHHIMVLGESYHDGLPKHEHWIGYITAPRIA